MSSQATKEEVARWSAHARATTIVRDEWGIAHVKGKTDADAVFGMIYAQAEDDFNRVETNYLSALGRLAEVEGEGAVFKDLRARLFVNVEDLKLRYTESPDWLRVLMDAWSDGLNCFLAKNRHVRPRLGRFEPWMALSFVEGGILGDIGRVPLKELQAFYSNDGAGQSPLGVDVETFGSNAFAIAPSNTANGRALLLINPHPDFYFRTEIHVQSEEGLNCYGTATWGQFFIFQGFNERLGWGHTTSGADTVDEYAEDIVERSGRFLYRYGAAERDLQGSTVTVRYRTSTGNLAARTFSIYRTHRGPVIRKCDGKWISIAMMYKPIEALTQSFLRMKARDYREFFEVGRLKANSIVNAVYADADGNIAYLHPQFMPRRNDAFDFALPVDGSDPETDWKGEHDLEELPNVLNPPNGWIANTNDAAYGVAGTCSPTASAFPAYMDTAGENPRGVNAKRLLQARKDFTPDSLVEAAYDSYLTAFAELVPALISAFDETQASDTLKQKLAGEIAVLRAWDYRFGVDSVATSLAVFWGEQVLKDFEPIARDISAEMAAVYDYMMAGQLSASLTFRAISGLLRHVVRDAPAVMKLRALSKASARLSQDFGTWRTPWGEINRFQRLTGDIAQMFDDSKPSAAVPLTSSLWGALASFRGGRQEHTKRHYGISGNSFVAVVEFGDRIRARAISAGGASGDPASPHFNDQGVRFATGKLRDVYFYPDEVRGHAESVYQPGALTDRA